MFGVFVVALKTCKVSCFDLNQVEHTVEVSAGSVYETVAQALRISRDDEWVEDIGSDVYLSQSKASRDRAHRRVRDFERWLEANPYFSAEMILKSRLRELLAKRR
jgi:hypothetical protein